MRPIRIYLSGPITGTNDYIERFLAAEQKAKRSWNDIVNPAKIDKMLPELTHEEYMSIDLVLLNLCDAILMMKGWEQSEGCMQEYKFAKEHQIMILGEEIEEEENESM